MTQSARQAAARIRTFRVSGFGFRVGNPQPATRNPQPAVSGQTTAEYAILIGVVVAALVGMQVYVKRGMNARLKTVSDNKSEEFWVSLGKDRAKAPTQYEPYYASSTYDVTQKVDHEEVISLGGVATRKVVGKKPVEETTRTGSQTTAVAIANPQNP